MDSFDSFSQVLGDWLAEMRVPEALHRRLYDKIQQKRFDVGISFLLARLPNDEGQSVADEESAAAGDGDADAASNAAPMHPGYFLVPTRDLRAGEDIWLIDHVCTFQLSSLREALLGNPDLCSRLEKIVRLDDEAEGLDCDNSEMRESRISRIYDRVWPYVGYYQLLNPRVDDMRQCYWYVNDEVGSAVNFTSAQEEANTRLEALPFFFAEPSCVFSILWLTSDVEAGNVLTRCPHHRFEAYAGTEVSQMLYTSPLSQGEEVGAALVCREAWQRWCQRHAWVAAQHAVHSAVAGVALELQTGTNGGLPLPVYPALAPTTAGAPLLVYINHPAAVHVLDAAGPTAERRYQAAPVPSEASVVWMTHHEYQDAEEFPGASIIVYLPELVQLVNPRQLAALVQSKIGDCPSVPLMLDGVTQLKEFIGSCGPPPEETNEEASSLCRRSWLLIGPDGNQLHGPVEVSSMVKVREVLRICEMTPMCLVESMSSEALTLVRGSPMTLHFLVLLRSLRTSETSLEAFLHDFFWASFTPAGPLSSSCGRVASEQVVAGTAVSTQVNTLTSSGALWETEILPTICRVLHDILAGLQAEPGVNHARCRAVAEVTFQLRHSEETGTVIPVLLQFCEHPNLTTVLRQQPAVILDILNTLCFGSAAHARPLRQAAL